MLPYFYSVTVIAILSVFEPSIEVTVILTGLSVTATGVTNPFETVTFESSSVFHVTFLLEAVFGLKVTFNCLPLESLAKDKDKLSPSSILIEFTGVVTLIVQVS